ncbi:hypothetical protein ABT074_42495, partial [Streptomyces sp. NPDC002205]
TANPGGSAPAESEDGSSANDQTYLRGYRIANGTHLLSAGRVEAPWSDEFGDSGQQQYVVGGAVTPVTMTSSTAPPTIRNFSEHINVWSPACRAGDAPRARQKIC